jgi:hypothetical protein
VRSLPHTGSYRRPFTQLTRHADGVSRHMYTFVSCPNRQPVIWARTVTPMRNYFSWESCFLSISAKYIRQKDKMNILLLFLGILLKTIITILILAKNIKKSLRSRRNFIHCYEDGHPAGLVPEYSPQINFRGSLGPPTYSFPFTKIVGVS